MKDSGGKLILGEQLRDAIGNRKVVAAVFLTYQFEPAFFEERILTHLFDDHWHKDYRVRTNQLEEHIRQGVELAVVYDRRGLIEGAGSATLPYKRLPVHRPGGVFHAKNILILTEVPNGEQSLLLFTMSANLTRAGWLQNLEAAFVTEIADKPRTLLRDDILGIGGFAQRIQNEIQPVERIEALERIRTFLRVRTQSSQQERHNGLLLPRLYFGQARFSDYLADYARCSAGEFNLEIISPYLENSDNPKALQSLISAIQPRETRIYLPMNHLEEACCAANYFRQAAVLPSTRWAALPAGLTAWSGSRDRSGHRFVHSKIYRLWSRKPAKEYLVIGSINLTDAAYSEIKRGNFESAIVFETDCSNPDWWLEPIEKLPTRFSAVGPEEELNSAVMVRFRFDWRTKALTYYADPRGPQVESMSVRIGGVHQFDINSVSVGEWVELPSAYALSVQQKLITTSFLEIVTAAGEFTVLIEEEGMEQKPTLLLLRSVSDILEYWSQLSSEQRLDILERATHELEMLVAAESGRTQYVADTPSMFDRFAGIFHAFSCLQERVLQCIRDGQDREALVLLFGQKHDSLPVLLDKIAEGQGDRVNDYLSVLSADQLIRQLLKLEPEFFEDKYEDVRALRKKLKLRAALRDELESTEDIGEFLDWFEHEFIRAVVVEEPTQA